VLVEFPRGPGLPPNARAELERICHSGVVPVVAHPERYPGCTVAELGRWRAAGAVSQGTAATLAAPGRRGDAARALLAAGALDVLASDNHGDGRSLAAARALLDAHGAGDVAALLTAENPARVLRGERPLRCRRSPCAWACGRASPGTCGRPFRRPHAVAPRPDPFAFTRYFACRP
jgi:protein-tyrosine phosphatase